MLAIGRIWQRALLAAAWCLFCGLFACTPAPPTVYLWHPYRGDEARAVRELAASYSKLHDTRVEVLEIPFGAYSSKLEAAIPRGHGPDLFIDAHERLAHYVEEGLVAELPADVPAEAPAARTPAERSVYVGDKRFGAPLSQKCLALLINDALFSAPVDTLEALLAHPFAPGVTPLMFEAESAYVFAPFLHAFGGQYLRGDSYAFSGPEAEAAVRYVRELLPRMPEHPNGALVSQMFASGKVAAIIGGPWLLSEFQSDTHKLPFPLRVVPLPKLAHAGGATLRPFLTVDALMVTPEGATRPEARAFAKWFVDSPEANAVRRDIGRQVIIEPHDTTSPGAGEPASSDARQGFVRASRDADVMPTSRAMRAVWVPAEESLKRAFRPGAPPLADVFADAAARFAQATRPPPAPASASPLLVVFGLALAALAYGVVRRVRTPGFAAELRASRGAYGYVTHTFVFIVALIVLPLAAGTLTSFYAGSRTAPVYVGWGNYVDILTAHGAELFGHGSFYVTLMVTILWTVVNVALHLGLGVLLALLLSRPTLRLRPLYRTLLILPWAVPSYVTALSWKGMFHRQYGAVSAILAALGVTPISWFDRFSTAFAANVATNVWLGFPFMMVVTMGALTSIPKDVLEAAEIDGATPREAFFRITLPLLRPTLLPAVVLGAIWTFNMFNVIYLVSEGQPDGATEILVSEAYRYAFTRDSQMGYAAAYAVLIFGLMFLATRLTSRVTGEDAKDAT